MMVFTKPVFSVGWLVAFVIAIITIFFWGMGLISKEVALPTLAICAVSL